MYKICFLLALLSSILFCANDKNATEEKLDEQDKEIQVNLESWNFYDYVELKKDQVAKYTLLIDNKDFELEFRWTLFVNDGLVTLFKYKKFNKQAVLYASHRLEGFKIELKERATNANYRPYAYIAFKKFDKKTKKALFHVFLKDEKRTILVDRVLPKVD